VGFRNQRQRKKRKSQSLRKSHPSWKQREQVKKDSDEKRNRKHIQDIGLSCREGRKMQQVKLPRTWGEEGEISPRKEKNGEGRMGGSPEAYAEDEQV